MPKFTDQLQPGDVVLANDRVGTMTVAATSPEPGSDEAFYMVTFKGDVSSIYASRSTLWFMARPDAKPVDFAQRDSDEAADHHDNVGRRRYA